MTGDTYIKIFSLQCFHTYFENGKCEGLNFSPGERTTSFIQRFGIRIIMVQNGFDLYAKTDGTTFEFLTYLNQIEDGSHFDFDVQSTNPSFYSITSVLPLNQLGQLVFRSNSDLNTANETSIELVSTFSASTSSPSLMSLTIYVADLLKLETDLEQSLFTINFEARPVQWCYNIINRSSLNLVRPQIISNSGFEFEGPTETVLPNGDKAMLFTSGHTMFPFEELPTSVFELKDNTPQPKLIFSGLPSPNPNNVEIREKEGTLYSVSSMYVYI